MTTATLTPANKPQLKIQSPLREWFVPLTRNEIDRAASDVEYAAFQQVNRQIGAWASAFPAERRGRYIVETPDVVYVPLGELDFASDYAGEARCLTEDGKTVTFDFEARLSSVIQSHAAYRVTLVYPDREIAPD